MLFPVSWMLFLTLHPMSPHHPFILQPSSQSSLLPEVLAPSLPLLAQSPLAEGSSVPFLFCALISVINGHFIPKQLSPSLFYKLPEAREPVFVNLCVFSTKAWMWHVPVAVLRKVQGWGSPIISIIHHKIVLFLVSNSCCFLNLIRLVQNKLWFHTMNF